MSNTFFAKRALLPALLAAAFGAIALSLALLITPGPAVAQTAPPDADVATVRFADNPPTMGNEGAMVTLRVQLQDGGLNATRAIDVRVQLTGGIGGTMGDVRTLTIPNGMNGGTLDITLPSDNFAAMAPADVVATLLPPIVAPLDLYDVVSGMGSSVTITVTNDDTASVGFGAASYTVAEGSGTVTVPVELKGSITFAGNTGVRVTVQGAPGGDQMLIFSAVNTSRNVTFPAPNNDVARVAPPNVTLTIVPAQAQEFDVASGFGTATVRFTDDDAIAEVGFTSNLAPTADEGATLTLTAALANSEDATRTIEVRVNITGGLTRQETLMINNGDNSGQITITLPDDEIQGDTMANRDVVATLVDDFFYDVDSATNEVTITVADDDRVSVGFEATSYTVRERASITVRVELKTDVNPANPIEVRVNISRPGPEPRLMLSSGDRFRTFTYNASDNMAARVGLPDVTLSIMTSSDYDIASGFGRATVRTTDDGDPIAEVRFTSATNLSGNEGTMVTLRAALQGSQNATRAIDVRVDLSGGGMGEQTLTIPDGANFGELQITLPTDNVAGMAPMDVVATLVDRIGGATTGTHGDYDVVTGDDAMRTITVMDDDRVLVGFGAASYTFREGEQFRVPVELKGTIVPANAITVRVGGFPGQAERAVSLSSTAGSNNVTFTAPDDDRHAPPPPVTLEIVSPQGFDVDPSFGTTTVSFTDDGDPAARVGFVSPPTRLTEREQVTLNLALMTGGPATRAVTVTVTDDDGFSRDVTIGDTESSASFTYTAPNDQHARIAPEDVTLRLTDPMNGGVASGSDSAKISFRDDGDALAVVGFVSPPTRLTEGEPEMLSVALEGGAMATRAITVTVTDGHGLSQMVTIPNGQNSASFRYTPPDDDHARIAPASRTLQLMLAPMDGMLASASAAAPISFRDDNDPLAVVGFAPRSDRQILQGGRVKFVAQLQGGVKATDAVHLRLMFSDGRAPETVTIQSGDSMVEYVLRTTSSGPTPPPLRLTIALPGGQALNADAASATLVQIPPIVGAEVPSAGGLELGWGALAALLAFALALLAAGGLLLASRYARRRAR